VCERILASGLFRKGDNGRYDLRNQSVSDLFLARWADRVLAAEDGARCDRVEGLARLFESSEVASFLTGLPNGGACTPEIVASLCRNGTRRDAIVGLVDQGLPPGFDRAALRGSPLTEDACVADVVKRLVRRLPAPAPEADDAR